MKKIYYMVLIIIHLTFTMGCAKEKRFHKSDLPDPASFNAHFGDMDADGDDWVSWDEFKNYFPQATSIVFTALDLDKNELVDHDEWHAFKDAHGLLGND